ncbi:MalY/PatB family protein [Companilactobacillus kimchii]|uniref:cysteine-S-conjugate beta-lyase n=2 Tax=Companilactobacillus kimchii TaxID=2801452 RepID=A0ABR5NWS1_9LACO|nr:MalY/PatB family protein [Companilactobacillus kimchii]KAE9559839.1 beta-cystathionase [Companilactobacillus kimchii]KRK53348.1 cystathionine beta-lyase [Companilactobacillus kimchii DSM 13961 = JCM 10707]OWF33375.1 Cystathionine beta-lyase [Companilactobacillus kimchii]GEO46454.1 cystathionine beta-lyase [Companilactobacillus paralimentarius]
MKKYDFDQVIDRRNTYSTQWDYIADRFGRNDILPFSISDTDFSVPDSVQEALKKRIEHPIYGYSRWNHDDYKNSIVYWFKARNNVEIDPEWIVYSPSVVFSIGTFIKMLSNPNESVATFTPMYDAFYKVIESNQRNLAPVRLGSAQQGYQIDWDSLETVLSQEQTKIFLLTNPHNPTGKVFSQTELNRINDICKRNNVFLISDDIHKDIVYSQSQYTPITSITTENIVLCCSGSKTFNTPGLIGSYILIPDKTLREQFLVELKSKNALSSVSILGMYAQMASYSEDGLNYVNQLVDYTDKNMDLVKNFLDENLPDFKFTKPEATYLAWIDISKVDMSMKEMQDKMINVGKVGIMPGSTYGDSNYLRMNIACPKSKLEEGLKRLKNSFN